MLALKFKTLLGGRLSSDDFSGFESSIKALGIADDDLYRTSMDMAFKQLLTEKLLNKETLENPDLEQCKLLVDFAIKAAQAKMCLPQLPITLLADILELLPLNRCQELFLCIENNVSVWKSDHFFTPVRNHLLRICNELLRRLSHNQNTEFCGRIQVFLAKFFPISERSGLNIISEFNVDNTTVFSQDQDAFDKALKEEGTENNADEKESAMEVDGVDNKGAVLIEEDEKNLNIDYALYKKFWELQEFFRLPTKCYEKINWKKFTTYAKDVLNTFESFKLDSSVAAKSRSMQDGEEETYFPKYLTNQHLLQLQLSDSNFRRYILVQFLILFQYLQSAVKFKNDSEVLIDEQNRWIKSATERVYKLIEETPPNGKDFSTSVKGILRREQQWNIWKNEGCQKFSRAQEAKDRVAAAKAMTAEAKKAEEAKYTVPVGIRKRKRPLGDAFRDASTNKKFLMGNLPLTKLWNLYPNNLEACRAEERDFLPSLEEYFSDAIEELNPEAQVDKEYRKVNDGSWGWRALRLMAKKSPHFFTYGNTPIAKLPDYLETMMKKMSRDSSLNSTTSSNQSGGAAATSSAVPQSQGCSAESLSKLSERLGARWRELIPKLGLSSDVEKEVEKERSDEKDRALLMLNKWQEAEGEAATADELQFVLERLKMGDMVADGILSTATQEPASA